MPRWYAVEPTHLALIISQGFPRLADLGQGLAIGEFGVSLAHVFAHFILEQQISAGRSFGRIWVSISFSKLAGFCLFFLA